MTVRIIRSTTVTFSSGASWPEDYGDMTLDEAIQYEKDVDLFTFIDFADVVGKTNTVITTAEI